MANRFLTAPQAARELGVAPYSVHRMARRGDLRYQRLGRLWLFDRREIRRLRRKLAAKQSARTRSEGEARAD